MAQLTYEARFGFFDPEHTRDNGLQMSQVTGVAGDYYRGTSTRYDGASSARGATAWIATADGTTTRVGLYSGNFGSSFQLSTVLHVNGNGISAGTSGYYNGFSGLGTATWIATSDGATAQTGLTTALYTRHDGYRSSTLQGLTETGFSYGSSDVYNGGSTLLGQAAWVASPTSNNRVGLTGALFTGAAGEQNSVIVASNSIGTVVGNSTRYNGSSTTTGQSAFRSLADGSTAQIGLYDAAHTRSDGYVYSSGQFVTDTGYTAGVSNRYVGSSQRGQSAWRADSSGATTRLGYYTSAFADGTSYTSAVTGVVANGSAIGYSIRNVSGAYAAAGWIVDTAGNYRSVGLSGTGYTNVYGYASNRPTLVTNSGYVAGQTTRYSSIDFSSQGSAAFVENLNPGGSAVRVGLYDAAHVDPDGYANNTVQILTQSGRSSGIAGRNDGGESVWAAQADGTSYQVGNYGAGFAIADGSGTFYRSQLGGMTESGYVWGTSTRDVAGGYAGWLFSLDTATQISLSDYDVLAPGGYGTSAFLGVNEDGVAYGYYANGYNTLGFVWSAETGFISVGEAVDGGIAQYDWSAFQTAFAGADGIIAGTGLLENGSTAAYLVVPEPSSVALIALALVGILTHRIKRNCGRHKRPSIL